MYNANTKHIQTSIVGQVLAYVSCGALLVLVIASTYSALTGIVSSENISTRGLLIIIFFIGLSIYYTYFVIRLRRFTVDSNGIIIGSTVIPWSDIKKAKTDMWGRRFVFIEYIKAGKLKKITGILPLLSIRNYKKVLDDIKS